jgi:ribonuclease BN (tRNA processing enzyme)
MSWISVGLTLARVPPVQIYGPPSTKFLLHAALEYLSVSERIFNARGKMQPAASMFVAHDILHAGMVYQDDRIRVTAVENTHYHLKPGEVAYDKGDKSYAYRFDTPNRSVVFTGDTGSSEAVTRLARGADVLVSEVIDETATRRWLRDELHIPEQPDVKSHMVHEHITPEEVGEMAAKAHVGSVLLTHFVPGRDSETDMSRYTAGIKKYFSGPVIVGRDLFVY